MSTKPNEPYVSLTGRKHSTIKILLRKSPFLIIASATCFQFSFLIKQLHVMIGFPPWFNNEIGNLIKMKIILYKLYLTSDKDT